MKPARLAVLAIGFLLFVQAGQAQWEPTTRLTWNSGESSAPRLAVDSSGGVHMVWYDNTPGNSEIFYKKTPDGGGTWEAAKRLTFEAHISLYPDIAIDPLGRLHVIWMDNLPGIYEIYYKRSTDGGATWSDKKRLTWTSGTSITPAVAADSSNKIHVVWADNSQGHYEVYYKKSTDGGDTWSTNKKLSQLSGVNQYPDLAVAPSGDLYVAWMSDAPGNFEIYYRKSTNGGDTWSATQRLTWNTGESTSPAILAGGSGTLHVVWSDSTPGNSEIYYKKSTTGGNTWSTVKKLTTNEGQSLSPRICADANGYLHLVWFDLTPGSPEIYYRRSTDKGATWTTAERLCWNTGTSQDPDIAAFGSGNYHVVWSDSTPGNYEIYYRRKK